MISVDPSLRRIPQQERSRQKLQLVIDAADRLLAVDGADALATTRIAAEAGVSVGTVYQYFPDKEAIAEALARQYWKDFAQRVDEVAVRDEAEPLEDPLGTVIDALAEGFRSRPGFRALWFGGLRTERIRAATRPIRDAVAASVERILAVHYADAAPDARAAVARMVVLTGDGLLREAFRLAPQGHPDVLREARIMLEAYIGERLR